MEPGEDQPGGVPMGEILGDVPLFREIQRVLVSSPGPINWELARQVGIAVASWGTDDPPPTEADLRGLTETVRAAELAVANLTGLSPPADVPEIQAFRRAQWVEATVLGLRDILDPVAAKLSSALESRGALALPEGQEMLGALMGRMVPLLTGVQVGVALGHLGQRALAQFDLAVPRAGSVLHFVVPNLARFESDWSLPAVELRGWVALHEVAHRFEFARPWVREHFLRLVRDLVEHAEIDLSELERGLEGLDLSNPEAFTNALESTGNFFGRSSDPEQRLRIARVRAFLVAAEGYADHVVESLGSTMLSSYGRIDEAMRRHRDGGAADQALERLLGLEMNAEEHARGRAFFARVAELTDEATLGTMWSSAEALPSVPELEEPTLWLARMA